MPNKTAFVTGGTGFIGLNLVEHLTQSGWDVIALHRPKSRLTYLQKYPVSLVEGAIEDAASLDRAMPEDVDAVFHVAGDVSLWSGHKQRQWRTNVEGTRNMVATALAKRSRNSCTRPRPLSTGFLPNRSTRPRQNSARTVSITRRSKAVAEEEVANGIAAGIGRGLSESLPMSSAVTTGARGHEFIRLAANRQLFRIPPGRACYADVGAVVRAHLAAVEKGRTGHNYIFGGTEASYAEIVQMVGKLLGQPTNTARRPAAGIARRRPRLGMDIDDHRERATDFRGIGGNRERRTSSVEATRPSTNSTIGLRRSKPCSGTASIG